MSRRLTPKQKHFRKHARGAGTSAAQLIRLAITGYRNAADCPHTDIGESFRASADRAARAGYLYAMSAARLAHRAEQER